MKFLHNRLQFPFLLFLSLWTCLLLGTEYAVLYTNLPQTVTATLTFAVPATAPFAVGATSSNIEVSGLRAAQATQLAANGANCAAGNYPLGVDASGAVESCTAAGGGGGNHAMLSATHTDTTAAAVSRGDLITGQAGPAWVRLAVGAANKFLATDGTDVVWSSWTLPAPTGDDYIPVADSTTATTWRALPNCTDVSGNHLNYTAATNAFSCGNTVGSIGQVIMGNTGSSGLGTVTTPRYWPLMGAIAPTGTEGNPGMSSLFSLAGTIKTLYCILSAAPGAGATRTLAVRIIGGPTSALTCTINNPDTTCSDLVNTVAVSANTSYEFIATGTGTLTGAAASCGVQFTQP